MMRRLGLGVLALAATAGFIPAGAGQAAADTQLPRLTVYSETIGTFGDHDFCRGAIKLGYTVPTGKRGVVRMTFTSHGFIGNGAGWRRNPTCRALLIVSTASATAINKETYVPIAFGSRPGQRITRDIVTGSGPVNIGVNAYALNTVVRTPQGQGVGAMALVP
ncbi:enoyl-CoA hydratase [Gordonia sp. CPCC 205515]|uniref:enoyl-CoA hydratase n=1 Tax=Gordonia sp. CPCC 205515 TaxID=3140791 RepID=UPI003AF36107